MLIPPSDSNRKYQEVSTHYPNMTRQTLRNFLIHWGAAVVTGLMAHRPAWQTVKINQAWDPILTVQVILWMEEILHHQKDGWNPINNGMFTIYQLVQDFATIHSITAKSGESNQVLPFFCCYPKLRQLS